MNRTDLAARAVALALSLLVSTASAATLPPFPGPYSKNGPLLTFDDRGVVASNVTPGATVSFACVAVRTVDHRLILDKPGAVAADTDRDGIVRFDTPVQPRSVWLVVDGTSGGYTVSAPDGFLLRLIDAKGEVVRGGAGGTLRRLVADRNHVDLFLVRPQSGMWTANVKDGHDDDRDINGSVVADLSAFRPLGSTAPVPDRILPGDVLFIVDRNTFEFHVTKHGR